MRLSRAASRYAKAILSLAVDKNEAAAVNEDMKNVMVTISKSKDLQNFLTSPLINAAKRKAGLKEVFKGSNALTQGLFNLLVENNRSEILQDVAMSYVVLFEEMNKREIATVTTAVEITPELEKKVLAKAKELAGKEITLQKKIDPSIIGGFVLRVGDKEINASVQNKFGELKRTFASY
ncbi:ATP synthase F1 subunit delta [Nonlabens spongiae]|uniref:ATP synthase subunit delta n=1 Tax=Nonlabens spongiae TaxID=331648 RepID=A0A1W6MLA0_9FLAO|nr:ATP synthase F1 subunit delta [Nonlabens spongiae]ARN78347.1 ATP synthase F1 subunit delta [Nonlabens spongiae]